MYLVDTNIFLEILLMQDKNEDCKTFLDENVGKLHITDFSLHSIGIILFRYGKEDVFPEFLEDVFLTTELLSLPMGRYEEVVNAKKNLNLDFDDAYQYSVAKSYGLDIVTMDEDFKTVKDVEIVFL